MYDGFGDDPYISKGLYGGTSVDRHSDNSDTPKCPNCGRDWRVDGMCCAGVRAHKPDDMGRWMSQSDPQPDTCEHGNHATSLKNLELQFTGRISITPCPVCLEKMKASEK